MTKSIIRYYITDFWRKDNLENYPFFSILFDDHTFIKDKENPDILFYSSFGTNHLTYNCLKVFFTAENVRPDRRLCDFSFSFEPTDRVNFQLPNFVLSPYYFQLQTGQFSAKILEWQNTSKTRFCNFVYSNRHAQKRKRFFKMLATYKSIDSPGKVMNNMPMIDSGAKNNLDTKLAFMKFYKFSIAFENEGSKFYTTEKLLDPLLVGSIPIYWGNPSVTEYFNPESFISCHNFNNFQDVVDYVRRVDQDDSLYQRYRSATPIIPGSPLSQLTQSAIKKRFASILAQCKRRDLISSKPQYRFYKPIARLKQLLVVPSRILRCYLS